jgi:phage-related protein
LTRLQWVAARRLSGVPLLTARPIAARVTWRIVYRLDLDAIVIAEVFSKKSQTTPQQVIDVCRRRLWEYDRLIGEEK